jgi:lipopolysaccharide biosynthesis glycosyltransferase
MLPIYSRQNSTPAQQRSDLKLFKSKSGKDKNKQGSAAAAAAAVALCKVPAALLAFAFLGVFCLLTFSQEAVVLSEATAEFKANIPVQRETDDHRTRTTSTGTGSASSLVDSKVQSQQQQQQKDKLSLEQWQQVQKSTVSMEEHSTMECKPLLPSSKNTNSTSKHTSAASSMALMVWAYDGPPDSQRLHDTIASFPKGTKVQLLCGSTACLERANRIRMTEQNACLEISRLNVAELAHDTPLATWADHHVLAKLLSGHHYEYHLQVAMQLAVLWKFGGVLLQPGVKYQAGQLDTADNANADALIGTCEGGSIAQAAPLLGGLWGLSSASPKSPSVQTMIENFLKAYRWDKPIRERYNQGTWPLDWSFEGLSASKSSKNKIKLGAACPDREFVDGHGGPEKYFGTLNYDERHKYLIKALNNHGMNLGDETQGLAGIQALPRLDAFVERDRLEMVKFADASTPPLVQQNATIPDDGRRVQVFFNAWWGTPTMTWPPPQYIDPISLSMHFQPRPEIQNKVMELPEQESDAIIPETPSWIKRAVNSVHHFFVKDEQNAPFQLPSVAPYLRSQAPIGARDTKTLKFLRDNGVQALFSACMTMTLSLPKVKRDGSVLIVDVNATNQLQGLVPDSVLEGSTFMTQKLLGDDADDKVLRFALAFERLLAYSRARLVITNRLHVAMPCVALGTPVIFVHGKSLPGGGGNRMDGLDVFMHQMREGEPLPADFNWEDPPVNPRGDDFKKQVKRIQQLATCHSGIADSSRKFGVMPADWTAGEERQVCTRESAWTANPNAIHIATSIDANFFELVFPSWVNALAKSNPDEPLVLYILTVRLSEKQRCLLRLMVLKMLPNAEVFTIPTSVAEFEKSYATRKRGHISIATQARLLMPSILPCVRKLLWLDLDAFVVGPIRRAWNEPTGKCGIAARSSIVPYMGHSKKYYPSLAKWHDDYGKSFNAGVMVVDLQQLRESQFEEKIVRYWASELGANDQVTFNIACNATHAELDPSLNVFQGQKAEYTPDRSEWIIAHFQSSKKPWSDGWDESWSSPEFWQTWEDTKMTFEQVLDL